MWPERTMYRPGTVVPFGASSLPGSKSNELAAGGEPGDLVGGRAGQQAVLRQTFENRCFQFRGPERHVIHALRC